MRTSVQMSPRPDYEGLIPCMRCMFDEQAKKGRVVNIRLSPDLFGIYKWRTVQPIPAGIPLPPTPLFRGVPVWEDWEADAARSVFMEVDALERPSADAFPGPGETLYSRYMDGLHNRAPIDVIRDELGNLRLVVDSLLCRVRGLEGNEKSS